MNLKKVKVVGAIFVFLSCVGLHFLYEFLPNFFVSIFAPVNESIWEHMKLIFSSFVLYGVIEYLIIRKKVLFNNYLFQLFLVPTLGIICYLVFFLPFYSIFGENIFISIGLLIVIIILEEILSFYILTSKKIRCGGLIGLIGIVLWYIVFGILTYNPPHNHLFLDITTNTYGINNKEKSM